MRKWKKAVSMVLTAAMALSVAALAAGYTACISGAQAVAKCWPGFFAVLQQLGAGIEVEKE